MPASSVDLPRPSVLFATPECAPLAKTGGLGDVSAALPAALREHGMDARVLLPGYPGVLDADPDAREIAQLAPLAAGPRVHLLESRLPGGVPLIIADCPSLYLRDGTPYQSADGRDWADNALRFGFFSRLAAILASGASPLDWRPDILHCNDWPAALAPAYAGALPSPAASMVTIHNLAFQGTFDYGQIAGLELPPATLGIDGMEFYGRYSFLKAGLVYGTAVTTVSPTYAREIQTEALGFGLHGVLRSRASSLYGVRNGIDTQLWNPETDPRIAARYGVKTVDAKVGNKRALKTRLKLAGGDERPIAAIVSRLTHQKGIDLVIEAAAALVASPAQLVVLGTGERGLIESLLALPARFPGEVAVVIGFDEELAHLIEAGADLFLMPSRFEPCGMNQMYSQRYGTLPLAHATGGLIDTIVDETHSAAGKGQSTGFLFGEETPAGFLACFRRAVATYHDTKRWRQMQVRAMQQDFGWGPSAEAYAEIYRAISISSTPSRADG